MLGCRAKHGNNTSRFLSACKKNVGREPFESPESNIMGHDQNFLNDKGIEQ